jgi:iron(III) transport system ATP-binding protein
VSSVTISALRKSYGSAVVVPRFDLHVEEGEFVALLGPSGCGKTTILRCIAGFEALDAGSIQLGESTVADARRGISVAPNRRDIGLVFQNYSLWPHMTVGSNVDYPLRVRRTPRGERRRRVQEVLDLVGLEDLADRNSMSLSGGQQQRVALARALVSRPKVLLLDEPLSNLDAQRRTRLRSELRRIHRDLRTTTVYVTHDQIEALTLAERIVVMNQGRVEQIGSPEAIFRAPANRFVAEFIGYENFLGGVVAESAGGRTRVISPIRPEPLEIAAVKGHANGQTLELAIRATAVSIEDRHAVSANQIPALVRDVTYLGDYLECLLEAGSAALVARVPAGSAAAQALGPGDEVLVSIAAENFVVLGRGDQSQDGAGVQQATRGTPSIARAAPNVDQLAESQAEPTTPERIL